MNVYKNMSALKYIIMCVNNWGLFLSQKKENGVKKVSEISGGESMCCEKGQKKMLKSLAGEVKGSTFATAKAKQTGGREALA